MPLTVHRDFAQYESEIKYDLKHFGESGKLFADGKRNKIRIFESSGPVLNIKSFKIPNALNKLAYRFFRKSKARRSYEFGNRLCDLGIGTPQPIAFFENFSWLALRESYYVSEHLSADLTFRELVEIPEYPDHENILRQFVRFCVTLHEKGVEFLDHSPGNTLISKSADGAYDFYLVDLNRMRFHESMDFESRMKNLSRLTPKKEMVSIMSNEYARHYGDRSEEEIFRSMWFYTETFQRKFHRKAKLKQRLGRSL